jgi:predicted nuclease of predicted toxin-antitoxin system
MLVVERLRAKGFDVEWIVESLPGADDATVLARAQSTAAVLITYDRDFGRLIFALGHRAPRNVFYSRLGRAEPNYIADRILALLAQPILGGHMATITREDDRLTPFPDGAYDG